MATKKKVTLPKLPYGEGSMSWMPDGETILYKKNINGKRCSVYGLTPKECMNKMNEKVKESEINKKKIDSGAITLNEAIINWHKNFKKGGVVLKENSYDREFHTINNQILKYNISNMQMQAISDIDITNHLNALIEKNYSYSTIKKTYEILNQFFKYYYIKAPLDNPMNSVNKPSKSAMNVDVKEIQYFDDEDIKLFINEATRCYSNGKPCYRLGYGLVAIMFTMMRVSEARALHWSAIDFEKSQYKILNNRYRVIDHEAGLSDDGNFIYKEVVATPKTQSGERTIYMCENAKEAFLKLREFQIHNEDKDFVFATSTGKPDSERNLRRCLNNIQERAGMKVQNSGLHVLRHTGISLMARNGVDEMVVASMAGQKDLEMIHRVYRHISESEKIEAVNKVNNIKELQFIF